MVVGVGHGEPFRISGTRFKNNEGNVDEEESVVFVTDRWSLSEDNALVAEVVNSKKAEAGSRALTIRVAIHYL